MHLGIDWFDWTVLIKIEILVTMGMAWLASPDKWNWACWWCFELIQLNLTSFKLVHKKMRHLQQRTICYLYLKTKRKFKITGHFYNKTLTVTLGFQVAGKHKNSQIFSVSGIWPKYSTGFLKTQKFLTGYGIWLLPGKRDSPKFWHGMRLLERKRYSAGSIRDTHDRSSGCGIVVKKSGNAGSGPTPPPRPRPLPDPVSCRCC